MKPTMYYVSAFSAGGLAVMGLLNQHSASENNRIADAIATSPAYRIADSKYQEVERLRTQHHKITLSDTYWTDPQVARQALDIYNQRVALEKSAQDVMSSPAYRDISNIVSQAREKAKDKRGHMVFDFFISAIAAISAYSQRNEKR